MWTWKAFIYLLIKMWLIGGNGQGLWTIMQVADCIEQHKWRHRMAEYTSMTSFEPSSLFLLCLHCLLRWHMHPYDIYRFYKRILFCSRKRPQFSPKCLISSFFRSTQEFKGSGTPEITVMRSLANFALRVCSAYLKRGIYWNFISSHSFQVPLLSYRVQAYHEAITHIF